ncbi:MAG: HPr family phosphocarrier protein [Verrucomicrobia bacterium]|nr:HPr family phosphocarrier protein [Verrucomicrobiota bacterium]
MSTSSAAKPNRVVRDIRIVNTLGLHARPASQLAQLAARYRADIHIRKGGDQVNAKSIMGIITLAAGQDTMLRFIASGPDAEEALSAIGKLVEDKFGED